MYDQIRTYYLKKKDGFTLIELIVVLVILGIILAITVPAVTSYIKDANDIKDDIKISYLNKAGESYKVRRYSEGTWKQGDDVFEGITTSKDKQTILLDKKLIDEYQTSIYDDTDYFTWDISAQRWTRGKGSSGGTPPDTTDRDNATILGDPAKGNNRGEYVKNENYKYGDIVESNGIKYKCVYRPDHLTVSSPLDVENLAYWKKIVLVFQDETINNSYETGDIVMYNNKYYKATGFDSSTSSVAYRNATAGMFVASVIIDNLFTEVVWDGTAFINAS